MPIFRGIEEDRAENGNQSRVLADMRVRLKKMSFKNPVTPTTLVKKNSIFDSCHTILENDEK
jgi:hypothetical protein